MTQEQYFEMCEALGETPAEENIPVEYTDFSVELQQILQIYNLLQDQWEGFNGIYIGKNITGIQEILDIFEIPIEDRLLTVQTIKLLDKVRAEQLNRRNEKPAK